MYAIEHLTRRNGGELTIESAEGEGSTFTFTIAKEGNDAKSGWWYKM